MPMFGAIIIILSTAHFSRGEDPCDKIPDLEPERLWNLMSANETTGVIHLFWNDAFYDLPRSRRKCVQKFYTHFVLYYNGDKSMADQFKKDNTSYFPSNVTKKAEDYKKTRMTIEICGENSYIIFEWHNVGKQAPGYIVINLDENDLLDLPPCSSYKFNYSSSLAIIVSLLLVILIAIVIFCYVAKKKHDKVKQELINDDEEEVSSIPSEKDTKFEKKESSIRETVVEEDAKKRTVQILEGEKTIMKKGPRDHWKIKHVDDVETKPASQDS